MTETRFQDNGRHYNLGTHGALDSSWNNLIGNLVILLSKVTKTKLKIMRRGMRIGMSKGTGTYEGLEGTADLLRVYRSPIMIKHVRPFSQFFFLAQGTKIPSNDNVALAKTIQFTTLLICFPVVRTFLKFKLRCNSSCIE